MNHRIAILALGLLCAPVAFGAKGVVNPAPTAAPAVAVISGMLYKIVPFLGWFHLQAQTGAGAGKIPNMKQFITENAARRHFHLHLAAVALLLPTPWTPPPLALPGLALLAASGLMLGMNLSKARKIFLAHEGRL